MGEEEWEEKKSVLAAETAELISVDDPDQLPQEQSFSFWGVSEIINPFGQQIAKAALHKEDEIFAEISKDLLRRKKILLPYLRDDDPHFTYRELQRILYNK